jgi:hypothetical protein
MNVVHPLMVFLRGDDVAARTASAVHLQLELSKLGVVAGLQVDDGDVSPLALTGQSVEMMQSTTIRIAAAHEPPIEVSFADRRAETREMVSVLEV